MSRQARRRPLGEQVVVITGASQGIGRETARLLAGRGSSVVAAARNEEALRTLADEIARTSGQVETVVADVSLYQDVERIGDRAIERFGRIDTWINNAAVGVSVGRSGWLERLEQAALARAPGRLARAARVALGRVAVT